MTEFCPKHLRETHSRCLYSRTRILVIWSTGPGQAFVKFVSFSHWSMDFLIYPGEPIPSTCFPYWDELVYTLLSLESWAVGSIWSSLSVVTRIRLWQGSTRSFKSYRHVVLRYRNNILSLRDWLQTSLIRIRMEESKRLLIDILYSQVSFFRMYQRYNSSLWI